MSAPTITTRTWQGATIPAAGTFALDPAHTRVGFVARHLMVTKVRGSFTGVSGEITVDPPNPRNGPYGGGNSGLELNVWLGKGTAPTGAAMASMRTMPTTTSRALMTTP